MITNSASSWTVLQADSSTGVSPYKYSDLVESRYRTEEYGKVARIQLNIKNDTPGTLSVPTKIAQLPAALSTGKGLIGCGFAIASSSTPALVFPVAIIDGGIYVACNGGDYTMSDDSVIVIDLTYPLD